MNEERKGRALGVGGIFFRSTDPGKLTSWYRDTLAIDTEAWGNTHGASFRPEAMPENSFTVWGVFAADTTYFGDPQQTYMFNLVVDDLDAALANVEAAGGEVIQHREEHDFGRFGWFNDPDGNRVELWEPPEGLPGEEDE